MFLRFIKVFGLLLAFMAVLALFLLAVILIAGDSEGVVFIAVLIVLVVGGIGMIPFLDWASKRVFSFPGEGAPVPAADLRAELLTVNEWDVPIMVSQKKNVIVFTWRYVDARWWEVLAKAGLTQVYELRVKLDEDRALATLVDVTKSVAWRAGPTEVRVRGGFFRGVLWAYEIGKQWGITENWGMGKVYDFRFEPQEIKMPVMNTILRRGWTVRFGMW